MRRTNVGTICRMQNPHKLLVGLQNGTAALESTLAVSFFFSLWQFLKKVNIDLP